ncbi:hypothetical protein PINS_up004264 [Pythium insidiosum]|nr:hypothetical protein PINS_up004264 [Pythium insidiosum]
MISVFAVLLAVATLCPIQAQPQDVSRLPVGAYYRPSGAEVSGRVGARTPFVRSPCPALNTLANHGYIPRHGHNIPSSVLRDANMAVFNMEFRLAQLQISSLPAVVSLSDLSRHNFIEHDVSLVHADVAFGQDPATVDGNLANDLLGRANGGRLGVNEVGAALRFRLDMCMRKPTGCSFGQNQQTITFREAASFLRLFGGNGNEAIDAAFAHSFLVEERIPAGWNRPQRTVTDADFVATAGRVAQATGLFGNGVVRPQGGRRRRGN